MRRRDIKQLFEQMGLTHYSAKNPKNERWKIPNEDLTIRIVIDVANLASFSGNPDKWKWKIQTTGRFDTKVYDPEDGIKEIQETIYRQFERQLYKGDFIQYGDFKQTWSWSSYDPMLIPAVPKPTQFKPFKPVIKPQKFHNKPRFNRLSYPGKH